MRFAFASKIPATKSSPPHKDTNDAQSASARGSKCFPLKSSAARNPNSFLKSSFKGENGRDPEVSSFRPSEKCCQATRSRSAVDGIRSLRFLHGAQERPKDEQPVDTFRKCAFQSPKGGPSAVTRRTINFQL